MLLRNKLSLMTLLFFLVAATGLVFALNHQNNLQMKQSAIAASNAQSSLWEKVLESAQTQLAIQAQKKSDFVLPDPENPTFRQILFDQAQRLKDSLRLARIEIYDRRGKQIFSSEQSYFPATSIGGRAVQDMMARNQPARGLVIDSERQTLLIQSQILPVGYLMVMARPIDDLILEFEALTRSKSLLINRRGRLLLGSEPDLWQAFAPLVDFTLERPVQILEHEERFYQLTLNRVSGALHDIGLNVTFLEITESHRAYIRLQWMIYGALGVFLILASAGLWGYLRQSLNPLRDAIDTLGRLAQGNYKQQLQVTSGRDEVARIGTSILKFHKSLIRLDRMKIARDNRGKRQSALIRRELSGLAETLDETTRQTVLDDLAEIEHQFAKSDAEITTGSELAAMALTLRRLRERIQTQHHQLAQTILELEEALQSKTAYLALQQELAIGARVQLAMLPEDLAQTSDYEITGFMKPAKEVGGDFYDFFLLDENRLGVVIADVSGKGIPAALFMAITRTVLRATAPLFDRPSSCIQALNDEVCANNKEELFVTLFYGIVDFKDHSFTYTNAGHNPIYHLKTSAIEALPLTGDVALGVMEGLDYSEHRIELKAGEGLFFYTDGITEAMNMQNVEFSTDLMEKDLRDHQGLEMTHLLQKVVKSVETFAGAQAQADDITCVGLRIK